jgi:hypothetical protein
MHIEIRDVALEARIKVMRNLRNSELLFSSDISDRTSTKFLVLSWRNRTSTKNCLRPPHRSGSGQNMPFENPSASTLKVRLKRAR